MSRRTALAAAAATPPASASAPFVAPDGEAHDAELERRWASVHAGLVAVLASLNSAEDGGGEDSSGSGGGGGGGGAAGRPAKRRRVSEVNPDAWMTVWADVHALFQHRDPKKKRRMYERVREFLRGYVRDQLAALRARLGGDGVTLLREYKTRWDKSVQFVKSMKRMLHHLQHFWVPNNCNLSKENPIRPLDRLLMFYWREELLAELPEITGVVLSMIDDDRKGSPIDHAPVKAVIDTLVVLGSADVNPMHETVPVPCAPPRPASSILDLGRTFRPPGAAGASLGTAQRRSPYDDEPASKESLHLYLQVFEDEFLKRTAAFYSAEADKMLRAGEDGASEDVSVSSFMLDVVARLEDEIARGQRLLHADSMPRLSKTVEEKLVGAHMEYLQGQADAMVRNGREKDLRTVFTLLERLDGGLGPIRDYLTKFIVEEGTEMMRARAAEVSSKQDVKKSLAVVDDMVMLHKDRTEMIQRCFSGSQIFVKALDDAFSSFMNRPIGSLMMAEVLAYYMDGLLRNPRVSIATVGKSKLPAPLAHRPLSGKELTLTASGASAEFPVATASATADPSDSQASSTKNACAAAPKSVDAAQPRPGRSGTPVDSSCLDAPIVQQMDRIIRLFMYVDDKDLFHETYRRLLAKRLLSRHDDALEREFISKLKMQTGAVYTGKISGMFQDVIISNEERQKFRARCEEEDHRAVLPWRHSYTDGMSGPIEFGAHVLNALYWPTFQEAERLSVPRPLIRWQKTFGEFYMRNKESRRITWIHSQSTNIVAAQLNGRGYTFHVSTFQACILLEFNEHKRRSLSELSLALNLQPSVLVRHIQPLVMSKKSPLFTCHGDSSTLTEALPGYATNDAEVTRTQDALRPLFNVPKEARETPGSKGAGCTGANANSVPAVQDAAEVEEDAFVDPSDHENADDDDDDSSSHGDIENPANNDGGGLASPVQEPNQESSVLAPLLPHGLVVVGDDEAGPVGAEAANGSTPQLADGVHFVPGSIGSPSAAVALDDSNHGSVAQLGDPAVGVAGNVDGLSGQEHHHEAAAALSLLGSFTTPNIGVSETAGFLGSHSHAPHVQQSLSAREDIPGTVNHNTSCGEAVAALVVPPSVAVAGGPSIMRASDLVARSDGGQGGAPDAETYDNDAIAGAISEAEGDDGDDSIREDSNSVGAGVSGTGLEDAPATGTTASGPSAASGNDPACLVYYELVPKFRSRTIRVQYPAQLARATSQEAAITKSNVVIDRNSLLDATLVRVMKQRKTLGYQQLMAEVLSQVSGTFKPEARQVKDRLEHLIEREFIERSPDDATVYLYAA